MERNAIIFEFLELRKQLNRGNKTADLVTAPSFVIEAVGPSEFRLLFCVVGSFEVQRIEIARCNTSGEWERSGYSSFKNFENYCADSMNIPQTIEEKSNRILNFSTRVKVLQLELSILLVNHLS